MTKKDVERWLNRAYKINEEIKLLKEEKYSLYKLAAENGRNKSIEYSALIDERINALFNIKIEIQKAINKIQSGKLRTVLICRYILFMQWERIADIMKYDVRHIYRIHSNAVELIQNIIDNDLKKGGK